jgi:hypothetical protein
MDLIHEFASWAWARHHNVFSWYIRPLFLIPYCYFAYRRSGIGIALTIVALVTSMFWFPVPETVSPAVLDALEAERNYLLGQWNVWKLAVALLVPLLFTALALALWRRSILWGLGVVNAMVLIKVVWTGIFFEQQAFTAHLLPALLGLAVCNIALIWWWRKSPRRYD